MKQNMPRISYELKHSDSHNIFLFKNQDLMSAVVILGIVCLVNLLTTEIVASEPDDTLVLSEIFGADTTTNTFALPTNSPQQPTEEYYLRLYESVFSTRSERIRCDIEFAPSYLPEKLSTRFPSRLNWTTIANLEALDQSSVQGTLLTPTLELIKIGFQRYRLTQVEDEKRTAFQIKYSRSTKGHTAAENTLAEF